MLRADVLCSCSLGREGEREFIYFCFRAAALVTEGGEWAIQRLSLLKGHLCEWPGD